ncbi:MAG TPA: sialidase family protein, partial [Thermoanaerobaculia bacterium]|nr:sialidase family protein [Thermoanaerobaculia bacterium]
AAVLAARGNGAARDPLATFVVPLVATTRPATRFHEVDFVSPEGLTPMVHVPSILAGRDGRLLAAWYGGSKEGARDVRLFVASRESAPGAAWSPPRVALTAGTASALLGRPVRKLGNAVLFSAGAGRVGLLFVSAFMGWSTSSLNVATSSDGGESFSFARRLVLSPFLNVSELAKNAPATLSDGSLAFPIYHDLLGKSAEILWLALDGEGRLATASKTRIASGRAAMQPALVPLSPRDALAFLRDESGDDRLRVARTSDGGRTWSSPEPTGLPCPRSGLDALRLPDGRVLVAFNDGKDRSSLSLAVSADEGRSFGRRVIVERESGAELSYPFLEMAPDGVVHLVYTWKRARIRHVAFDAEWLEAP